MRPTGDQLRQEGVDAVLAADTSVLRGFAPLVREAVDAMKDVFDAEDLRLWLSVVHPDASPHHPNVLPATLGGLASHGTIERVGERHATRPTSRSRRLLLWRRVTD